MDAAQFPPQSRSRRTSRDFAIELIVWLAIAVVLSVILVPRSRVTGNPAHQRARKDTSSLAIALRQYFAEYGIAPVGDHAAIIRTLTGENPNRIVFLELRAKDLDESGRFMDPWGSAYRIDNSDPAHPRVLSPGRNKLVERDSRGSDDIRSWE
jgi:hypothetical protein